MKFGRYISLFFVIFHISNNLSYHYTRVEYQLFIRLFDKLKIIPLVAVGGGNCLKGYW